MEVLGVARHMETIIKRLAEEGAKAEGLIADMAEATRVYKKARAIRSVELKAEGMAVTMIKHQAEGDAGQLEAKMIIATQSLKAHFARRDDLKAQLNGYQSIFRHLESTG